MATAKCAVQAPPQTQEEGAEGWPPDVSPQEAAAWGSLADPWALLNAPATAIREAAQATGRGYPQEEVEDLLRLLEGLREMYRVAGSGDLFTKEGVYRNDAVGEEAGQRKARAEETVDDLMRGYFVDHRMGYFAVPSGFVLLWWPLSQAVNPSVIVRLWEPLWWLLKTGLENANPSTVYTCAYCGRIGPAKQHNRTFCGATCRVKAWREKTGNPRG